MASADVLPLSNSTPAASTSIEYSHVDKILDRPGPQTVPDFQRGQGVKEFLRKKCKILVIGAGGLGCEILSNLALLGFGDVEVIDMDTIDVSNLNRQFLFRPKDVGKPKATVAAEFIMNRVPGVKVTAHYAKIQDFPETFYSRFNLIICGLDSIPARRWINSKVVGMFDPEDEDSLKPLIDGGTEGFQGQARLILPTITACIECTLGLNAPPTAFPICTIANTPRMPEHCIEWASVLQWTKVFPDKKIDGDDPEHIQWLYDTALDRANKFNIEGVTWSLTQGVVKRIIPAIASTNAIVAAACCNEAFKIATSSNPYIQDYMYYNGVEGVHAYTFPADKRPDCPVCGGQSVEVRVRSDMKFEDFVEELKERRELQVTSPSIALVISDTEQPRGLLYQAPQQLRERTLPNLERTLSELGLVSGNELLVTDSRVELQITVRVVFEDA